LERFRFGSDVAFAPREELLDGVTVAPLSRSISHGSPVQTAVFRVAPGGRIARHPATYPQILAVLDGSGNVSGPSGVDEPIEAGEAVFWQAGEEHETKTTDGLTALIIEGDGLEMFQRPMQLPGP
jgi:quercetin dioxygenase-like cupin family protein